ncbi:hypothetical protein I8752_25030 [Nostocaceae cyanobacterium CENA369]|uniref:Uncharacterized protein n=1 Tax=Dendronalium phyllosphericum CENA369 TaxID=1725256 RepID=A0A8J7IIY2_9NOST|nr:hypothetical protein [Dendronalium phyllosphericum]MBH8576197.1 hypothetical protein [Dendronalium phyllosphericum CENA369]
MCIDETIATDIREAVVRVSLYLEDFGSHISHLDFSIENLEDLKEEFAEGTDKESIDTYLYAALSRIKSTRKQLKEDIKIIKSYLNHFVESSNKIPEFTYRDKI